MSISTYFSCPIRCNWSTAESFGARFEAFQDFMLEYPPERQPPLGLLEARRWVYLTALTLATREYRRAEDERARRASGFSVSFEEDQGRRIARVILYDDRDPCACFRGLAAAIRRLAADGSQ